MTITNYMNSRLKKSVIRSARQSHDPIGVAIHHYYRDFKLKDAPGDYPIVVQSDKLDDDIMSSAYFFRNWAEMPPLEQLALDLCKGRVLDVGAAAGCHTKILLERDVDVLAIDTSHGAVEIMRAQELPCKRANFYTLRPPKTGFDTILMLMTGLGIAGTFENLPKFFQRLDLLLAAEGQVLFDSCDLGEYAEEFAEINYEMHFRNIKSKPFPWLFLKFEVLAEAAVNHGFEAEFLLEGDEGSYLARLQRKS